MIGFLPLGNQNQPKGIPKATLQFILACVIVHFITWRISSVSPDMLNAWLEITQSQIFNPLSGLSGIFIHSNFSHIFLNMFVMYIFAAPIELMEGRRRFWILVIVTALIEPYLSAFSQWMFYLWLPNADPRLRAYQYYSIFRPGIGASAVVSAFMFAYLVRLWRSKIKAVVHILGIPLPALLRLPAWALVLCFWLVDNLLYGILVQGMMGSGGVGYLAHLAGAATGLVLALRWGYHKHYKRDRYLEYAEDLAKAPISGSQAVITTLKQALAYDPQNGKIMLEIARRHHFLGETDKSAEWYRKAVLALYHVPDQEELMAGAYFEAFNKHQLLFVSEKQLELARLLLKYGHWQAAQKSLEAFCALLAQGCQNLPLYIRGKLILAYILDRLAGRQDRAGEIIENLLGNFPGHPLLRYAGERLEHQSESNPLFNFNPGRQGFPFAIRRKPALIPPPPKPSWYKVRPRFLLKLGLGLALAPVALLFLIWLYVLLKIAGAGLLGIENFNMMT